MDEFAGLDKGWNDPDMMVMGMKGLTETMNKTHMAMWCMMNAPLMLGLDLRRVQKGDEMTGRLSCQQGVNRPESGCPGYTGQEDILLHKNLTILIPPM